MAWNEPGNSGGKDRDPWGGRKDEQGPPDLDEVVKKLQDKLSGLFGGSGGGGGSRTVSSGKMGAGGMGIVIVLLAIVWGVSGFYTVSEGTRGVVLQLGAYKETTMPGLQWYPRFYQSVERVNVDNVRSIELGVRGDESLMLTQDENIVDIKFAVQYYIKDARDYLFNVRDPDETLRQAMETSVREIVGKREMDFIITGGRAEVGALAQELMQGILDQYKAGLIISSLNMQDAQAPQQVQGAFADAVKAREDEVRFKNEAEAYSNDVLPTARGQAARLLEEANAYKEQVIAEAEGETSRFLSVLAQYQLAPAVTRKRLYIDTMESVLSRSSKVLVDTKGNNNLLYLPLDKLMQREVGSEPRATQSNRSYQQQQPKSPQDNTVLRDDRRTREVR
jgi:membrane protease subunit HflK